jgi:manganese transport protein
MAAAGRFGWIVGAAAAPAAAGLLALVAYMILKRERAAPAAVAVSADQVAGTAAGLQKRFARIGVALEATANDPATLAEAISLAKTHRAELVLLHVVEGVGGQWYGPQTGDTESRQDEAYLSALAERLGEDLRREGVPGVRAVLGYGNVTAQLVGLAQREKLDLLVLGSHGHRGLSDVLHGATIGRVRHGLDIPILAVRKGDIPRAVE